MSPNPDPNSNPKRTWPAPAAAAAIITVAILQCLAVFVLYRGRAIAHWPISDSDFIVFFMPTLLASIAYLFLFARLLTQWWKCIACAVLMTILTAWASLLIPFNLYGT